MANNVPEIRPAGYNYLLERFNLNTIPHCHSSFVTSVGIHRSKVQGAFTEDVYPCKYWPGDSVGDHLEFALKYDGVNLSCLSMIFNAVDKIELREYIESSPTGKYARRIWFFYEFLTGEKLPVKKLTKGNYIEALESGDYYTLLPGKRVQRQRIMNNLPGRKEFCPIVRRTDKLRKMDSVDLHKRCEDIVAFYPPELLRRALTYLYKKETKSSFEIEDIRPNASRREKFIALLELAEHEDFCQKKLLLDLQNRIVDQREMIHYVSPKPDDLPELMEGLLASHQLIKKGNISPVIHAATVAYAFVFMHPFEDGNGRIHRFLIHNILATQGTVPRGLMFPVSAVMLKKPVEYDRSLEAFSRPLMQSVEYTLDETGQMSVLNDTAPFYRYMDLTAQAEALYDFISQTIEEELVEELSFLASYDGAKRAIQAIIDMPDRLIDLFIQLCLQNNGRLSMRKRAGHFNFLTDEELSSMEQAVRENYR